jgi:peptide deformylase
MLVIENETILRQKCEPVKEEEIEGLVHLLESELSKVSGIGLAAPQIGIAKHIAIVRISDKYSVNLVNAKIAHSYDPIIFEEEGCLSFPNKKINTHRFNEVHVVDNLVYPHSFIATGLFSICTQHELDHLNGILISDREVKKIIKQSPNEKCLCGSGLKHKKCCAKGK